MTDLNIVCFLAVARSSSFTIASADLSMTQQGISRNIQTLEEELGYKLFYRSTSSVSLTHAGSRFFEWCVQYVRTLESSSGDYDRLVNNRATISVGLFDWLGCPEVIGEGLRDFSLLHRDEVDINYSVLPMSEIERGLTNHTLDLVVITQRNALNIRSIHTSPPLVSLPLRLVLSRRHPFAKDSTDLSAIFSLTQLTTPSENEADPQKTLDRIHYFNMERGFPPGKVEIFPDMNTLMNAVLNGAGFAVSPYVFDEQVGRYLYFRTIEGPGVTIVTARQQSSASIWAKKLEEHLVYGGKSSHD